MTRTSSISSLVLAMLAAAVAAAPAAAGDGYRSVDSIVATGGGPTTVSSDPGSAKQLFAGTTSERPRSELTVSGYRSPDAIVALSSPPQPSTGPAGAQRYADALVRPGGSQLHPASSSPVRLVEVRGSDGFHWLDALIGALIAAGLVSIMLAVARTVARHRRATAESRA